MRALRLLFSRTRGPLSLAIRAATWSAWSHVAIVDDRWVIEAVAGHGVRSIPLEQALEGRITAQVDLPCQCPGGVVYAAASQLGKPYDYAALFGLAMRRNWQRDDAWFCSELVAWACEAAGQPLFRATELRRVTPQHLWMLAPAPEPLLFVPD